MVQQSPSSSAENTRPLPEYVVRLVTTMFGDEAIRVIKPNLQNMPQEVQSIAVASLNTYHDIMATNDAAFGETIFPTSEVANDEQFHRED